MKNIIIFDEIEDRVNEIREKITLNLREKILFQKDWDEYFKFSNETGFIEIVNKNIFDDIALIIIHQSHNDPKFPESAVAEIKNITAEILELYVYSGYKSTNISDKTLSRNSFNLYIGDFIQCYYLSELLCFEIFLGNNLFDIENLIKDVQITLEESEFDLNCIKTCSSFAALMYFRKRDFNDEINHYLQRPIDDFYNFLNTLL